MNLGDEYQNFLISMALLIAGDEGWTTNLWQFPSNLSPATKLVDGTHLRGGKQALAVLPSKFGDHCNRTGREVT